MESVVVTNCTNILHDAIAEGDARAKVTSSGVKEGRYIVHMRRSLSMSSVMQRRMKDSSTPQ